MTSLSWIAVFAMLGPGAPAADAGAERRAVAYLAREVPRWWVDHKCYSCHNNGDATRALIAARERAALADSLRWLGQPERWDKNGGDEAFSDKGLSRIQFSAALVDAFDAGLLKDRPLLTRAADLVAEYQHKDGCWQMDATGAVGGPTTYGAFLATHLARRTLVKADPRRFAEAIARDQWLRTTKVARVLDAAAVLLALEGSDDDAAREQRRLGMQLIRKGESKDGGWGPYVNSPPEAFDTAVVVLALVQFKEKDEIKPLLRRGRAYLVSVQEKEGNWPETTRPTGGDSYAQRISTTGWATLALLAR